jgi:hypothetical protein
VRAPLHALGHAILVLLYTAGVTWILFNGQRIFGRVTSFWGPLAALMLFVVSATIVGTLVLGGRSSIGAPWRPRRHRAMIRARWPRGQPGDETRGWDRETWLASPSITAALIAFLRTL